MTRTQRSRGGLARYVRGVVSVPLVRNAYSLVGATLATSGLGVVFWIVAARTYSTADVGTDAALISAMVFLSRLAQLNLASGFNRFVPTAGSATRRLVLVGYLASIALAAVAATIFVVGIDVWAPKLSTLTHDHWRAAWFVAATIIWTIFVLQDAVLTGLGEAPWVLVENAAYGVVKLLALVAMATLLPRAGVFFAWTAPLVLLVVPVNRLLFGRLIPGRADTPSEEIGPRSVARYLSVDFTASMLSAATSGLMPLLVLASTGARASAYLYLSWTIAYTVHFLSENVGMSLITEGSRDPDRLIEYARKTLVHSLRIVVPLAGAIALGAPLVLRAFGADYAANAAPLLQLLVISAIPNAVIVTYMSVARIRRRMTAVVAITAVQSVSILAAATVLLRTVGLWGVGLAWLATDTAIAAVLMVGELRTLWLPLVKPGALRGIAGYGRAVSHRRSEHAAAVTAREVLRSPVLAGQGWVPAATAPVAVTGADVYTLALESGVGESFEDSPTRTTHEQAILKLATSPAGVDALAHRRTALRALRAAAPPGWNDIVARTLEIDPAQHWMLETRCAGVDARDAVRQPEQVDRLLDDLARLMSTLYRATAGLTLVDRAHFAALVDVPLSAAKVAAATQLRALADAKSLARARAELHEQLADRVLTTAFVHGNLWLGNVLWTPANACVSGIVDWTRTAPGVPVVDIAHLLFSTRALAQDREIGSVVRELLEHDEWPPREAELLRSVPGATEISARATILLAWLQHIAIKSPGALANNVWISHNVHQVLESV